MCPAKRSVLLLCLKGLGLGFLVSVVLSLSWDYSWKLAMLAKLGHYRNGLNVPATLNCVN